MSNVSRAEASLAGGAVTVSFGERFQASAQFDAVFKEGMALVERTAAYLEGPGRVEAKRLPPSVNVLYASESMRLTTRLLDMASWLLIRRAVKEGDISEAEAQRKRKGVLLQAPSRSSHVAGFNDLPETLRGLVEESYALQDRIVQLDRAMNVKPENAGMNAGIGMANPVGRQLDRLRVAFGN